MSVALGTVLFIMGFELLLLVRTTGSQLGQLSMTMHLRALYQGFCLTLIGLGTLMIIRA